MAEYIDIDAPIDVAVYQRNRRIQVTLRQILESNDAKYERADVRPVVRGHIEEDENTYLHCSECNCNITLAAYETPNGNLILRPNYCPNCGADMREES